MPRTRTKTKRPQVENTVGPRLRAARHKAGLTQRQLAGDRYTAAYISALEVGLVRPSWAALTYLSGRLGLAVHDLVREAQPGWDRLAPDLQLAAGDWQAAADGYTQLLENATGTDAAVIRGGRAEALSRLGRAREALPDAAQAYEALTQAGQPVEAAYAGYWLAYAHHQLNNTDEARALLHQLLAEVRAGLTVQADFKLRLLLALAILESWDGHDDRALTLLEEGRALTGEMDDLRRATFLFSLANSYSETGDHEAALRAGHAALPLFEAANAERDAARLRNTLALTYLGLGNTARATELAAEARQMSEHRNDQGSLAHVTETEAQIALALGDHAAVRQRVAEALELARASQNTHAESSALLTLARSQRQTSDKDAEATYRQAADLLRSVGPRPKLAAVLREWSDLLVSEQRHPEAVELLREALNG
ncbi:MAG: helix-turn-helix domain-containing protein [Chloroflexota bacterium]